LGNLGVLFGAGDWGGQYHEGKETRNPNVEIRKAISGSLIWKLEGGGSAQFPS
jgi:hypothetical protein